MLLPCDISTWPHGMIGNFRGKGLRRTEYRGGLRQKGTRRMVSEQNEDGSSGHRGHQTFADFHQGQGSCLGDLGTGS